MGKRWDCKNLAALMKAGHEKTMRKALFRQKNGIKSHKADLIKKRMQKSGAEFKNLS